MEKSSKKTVCIQFNKKIRINILNCVNITLLTLISSADVEYLSCLPVNIEGEILRKEKGIKGPIAEKLHIDLKSKKKQATQQKNKNEKSKQAALLNEKSIFEESSDDESGEDSAVASQPDDQVENFDQEDDDDLLMNEEGEKTPSVHNEQGGQRGKSPSLPVSFVETQAEKIARLEKELAKLKNKRPNPKAQKPSFEPSASSSARSSGIEVNSNKFKTNTER